MISQPVKEPYLAQIEIIIATAIVVYVSIRYLHHYLAKPLLKT